MEKINKKIMFLFLFIVTGIAFFFVYNGSERKENNQENKTGSKNELKKKDHIEQTSFLEKNNHEAIVKSELSKQKKEEIIKKTDLNDDNKWGQTKKAPFGVVELIFVQKNSKGDWKPKPVYLARGRTNNDCGDFHFRFGGKFNRYSRWSLQVNENCKGDLYLGPDTKYYIHTIYFSMDDRNQSQRRKDVFIPFKTPSKKRIKKKKRHRIFIEINENIYRDSTPKTYEQTQPQKIEFQVSGMESSFFDEKDEVISVQYRNNKKLWRWLGKKDKVDKVDQKMLLPLQFQHNFESFEKKINNVMGGSLAVIHGRNNWRDTKLLYFQNKVNKKSFKIDGASKHSWLNKEWVTRKINLSSLLMKRNIDPDAVSGVALYFEDQHKSEKGNRFNYGVPVRVKALMGVDSVAKINLSAPAGEYKIGVYTDEFHSLNQKISWPPENLEVGAGSEEEGEK